MPEAATRLLPRPQTSLRAHELGVCVASLTAGCSVKGPVGVHAGLRHVRLTGTGDRADDGGADRLLSKAAGPVMQTQAGRQTERPAGSASLACEAAAAAVAKALVLRNGTQAEAQAVDAATLSVAGASLGIKHGGRCWADFASAGPVSEVVNGTGARIADNHV